MAISVVLPSYAIHLLGAAVWRGRRSRRKREEGGAEGRERGRRSRRKREREEEQKEEREEGGAEGRERKEEQKEERLFKVNSEKPWIPNKEHLSIKDTWFCPILIVPSRGIAINKEHFQFPKGVSGFTV